MVTALVLVALSFWPELHRPRDASRDSAIFPSREESPANSNLYSAGGGKIAEFALKTLKTACKSRISDLREKRRCRFPGSPRSKRPKSGGTQKRKSPGGTKSTYHITAGALELWPLFGVLLSWKRAVGTNFAGCRLGEAPVATGWCKFGVDCGHPRTGRFQFCLKGVLILSMKLLIKENNR